MKILGIIPARFASTRFPGKPLVEIVGQTMIYRTYHQVIQADTLSDVVVATDDEKIFQHVKSWNGKVLMTSSNHLTGTDRVAEIAHQLPDYEAYINIQGDEPFISPNQINLFANTLSNSKMPIATLIKKIDDNEELTNPSIVKVVVNITGKAMYFSRSVIPFIRSTENPTQWLNQHTFYRHIGMYGFTKDALLQIQQLAPTPLETAESLEQLRWLENNLEIQTIETQENTISIDTPQDLEKALQFLKLKQ